MWLVGAETAMSRRMLQAGQIAGPLFIAVFTLDGASRPGYQTNRHPVSSLALGSRGWLQKANFAVAGAQYLGSAIALSRTRDPAMSTRAGPALIGAAAAGILGAAVFTTDPVSGYPPGTPDLPTDRTTAGTLHDLVAIPTFLGLPMAAAVYSSRFVRSGQPGWAAYSAFTTVSMLAAVGMSGAGFNQAPRLVNTAGRWQRICIATGFTWLTALNRRALHQS
jgi:hypothetical protein